jgi:outer membrane autotransporter protein
VGNRQHGTRGRGIDNHQGGFQRGAVRIAAIGLAATTALTAPALAANRVWNGQLDDDWFTADNWDGSALPASPEVVVINDHSGTSMPFISGGDATAGTITVGTDGSTATLTINNGGVLTTGYWYDYIGGVEGTPAVAGSTGTVIVDGFGSIWTSGMGISIGHSGTGTLRIVNGGRVEAGPVITIGSLVGGVGTVVVDGADSWLSATTTQAQVGGQGTGSLTISNYGLVGLGSIQVGTGKINTATGADGTLLIESGGKLFMSAADQENVIANEADTTGSATITGAGSLWSAAGKLYIGYQGNGSATVSDGATVLTSKETYIAYIDGSRGSLTVDGANSTWTSTGNVGVGVGVVQGAQSATLGELTVSNGGRLSGPIVIAGWSTGSTGRIVVDGASSTLVATASVRAGYYGTGTIIVSNGGKIDASGTATVQIAQMADSTGRLIIGGETTAAAAGTVVAGGGVVFGAGDGELIFNHTNTDYQFASSISGAGKVVVKSGTTTLTGTNTYTGGTTISGGTLVGSTTSLTGNIVNNGTLTIDQDTDGTFAGDISGTGNLVKDGTGTVTLTGTLTYTGTTTILAGHLVGNTAVIGGAVDNDGVLEFEQASDGTYSSSITGSGSLVKTGSGTLVLTGTNSYTGGTTISDGTLVGSTDSLSGNVVNGASLVFDQGGNGQFAGVISGAGTLTKSGAGNLVLTGTSTYVGGTTVDAGRLSVNGSIASSIVEVLTGAELGGSGTVGGIVARSGSTLSPGNSIGTLNVSGDATLDSGSTYSVEVDAAGQSDKLAATGAVTIGSGVSLVVTPENGTDTGATYALNTQYTIITAQNGVTGTFATVTENFAYLTAAVTYSGDGKTVYLTLTRTSGTGSSFASLVSAPNAKAAAVAVDALDTSGVVYQAATSLATGEPERAFALLSGEIHPSIAGALIDRSHLTRDAIVARVREAFGSVAATQSPAAPDEQGHVWISSFGAWGSYDGDGNGHGLDANGGGVLVGADAPVGDSWRFGLAAGYGHDRIDDDAVTSSGSVDSYYLAGYGGASFGPAALRLGAIHAFQSISTDRTIALSTLNERLKADYDAGLSQAFAEGAWRYEMDTLRIEPYANAAYVHLRTDAFGETGGAAALSSAAASYDQFYTTLGVRVERPVDIGNAPARLTAGLGWRHAFGDVAPDTGLAFAGSGAFGVAAAAVARDTALFDAGIAIDFTPTSSLSIRYNGMLADGFNEQAVAARLGVQF